jgi:DNA adenine methylase
VITRDHFYHTGGKLENRRSVVEALVFNFQANMPEHTQKPEPRFRQYDLFTELVAEVA